MHQGIHPHAGIGMIGWMSADLAGKGHDIPRGGILSLLGIAGTVYIMGIVHTQGLSALVHPLNEVFFCPGQVFRQCHGAVVGTGHNHGTQQILQLIVRVGIQQGLTALHGRGTLRNRYLVRQGNVVILQCLKDKQRRHQLGDGSHFAPLVGILLKNDRAGFRLRQDNRGRGDFNGQAVFQRRRRGQGRDE